MKTEPQQRNYGGDLRGSISLGWGFKHDLGTSCRSCSADEARCALLGRCCEACTHWEDWSQQGEPLPPCSCARFTVQRIGSGTAPWAAQCAGCWRITGRYHLISAAVRELDVRHKRESLFDRDDAGQVAS